MGADLVVVGPEAPLVAGAADAVRARGIPCFGPGAEAARLEGSKAFAKDVMAAAGVPTGGSRLCRTVDDVEAALAEFGAPHVVKDDGLAAGKGVVVTGDPAAALEHARGCLAREGGAVVVEEYLDGPEVSLFCVTDGTTVVPLAPAQDFKRALDGDAGPNTGGMGAYSPLPWAPPDLVADVLARIAVPTVAELARRGTPFVGVALLRARADPGRAQGDRVQRPVRRPGDAGRAAPAGDAADRPAARRGDRHAGRAPAAGVAGRGRGHRRRRLRGLPGHGPRPGTSSTASTPPGTCPARGRCTPARAPRAGPW